MTKLDKREAPDFSDLLDDIDDALNGRHRSYVLTAIWKRLFEEVPAAHIKLQVKDRGATLDSEDEQTKLVVQIGQAIKVLSEENDLSGFIDISKLQRNADTT